MLLSPPPPGGGLDSVRGYSNVRPGLRTLPKSNCNFGAKPAVLRREDGGRMHSTEWVFQVELTLCHLLFVPFVVVRLFVCILIFEVQL